ncbi:hypothetical protein GCM10022247_11330 [Allokutzneria multivorans]|uniref:Uncharacterized protein n=1 Tax=Allokutzneria multivorans TaxID=1142134 RepID=A0ABP7R7Q5_9PSEU
MGSLKKDCYKPGDLCSGPVQDAFTECAKSKIPGLALRLGPWFLANCPELDATLIQGWSKKLPLISALMVAFAKKFRPS